LNHKFDNVYADVTTYLEDKGNEDLFMRRITGLSNGNEVQYSIIKHNFASPVRLQLILMDREREIIYTSFSAEDMNLHRTEFTKIVAENALKANTPLYSTVYYFSGDRSECVYAKPLYQEGELVGIVTVYLNGHDWGNLFSEYQYDCIITDLDGAIIYYTKNVFLPERNTNKYKAQPAKGLITVQDNRYRIRTRVLTDQNAILYSLVYSPGNALAIIVGVVTITILGGIWLVMFRKLSQMMAEKSAQSVDALVREIRILRHEDNEHIIQIDTEDEFEEIATQINKMVKSINDLNTRNTDLIKLNSMIEMRNLQTQINPHFIYNTLDNIKYLILEDPKKAAHLLEKFTHILRYSINNTKKEVSLAEDIGYIEDYLYIQKTRFGERFKCSMEIEPECGKCTIPKLLLQPLIENSIKYGFQKKMELSIEIRCWRQDDFLLMRVQDDGPGVSLETLAALRSMIVSEEIKTEHNGLQNLCRRIILKYGNGCGLFIDSEEGKSFTVTAMLLCRGKKDV
ncbi:MAG TPA: two-component sensor histidine kinase, partial [Firmicutes bacterium]|nr:two-component sensor histidine kinase [Bacillota bacterium]